MSDADSSEASALPAPSRDRDESAAPSPVEDSLVIEPKLLRNQTAEAEAPVPGRQRATRRLKLRYVRTGPAPNNPALQIVRGGTLDAAELFMHALRHHRIYGVYGISVFALENQGLDELAEQVPLTCFEQLTVFRVGDVLHGGLHLEPTGHDVRHYTLICEDFHEGVRQLLRCRQEVITNPRYSGALPSLARSLSDEEVDLFADLNAEDDDGLGWSTLLYARDPHKVAPGALLVAGDHEARAIVRVISLDDDGQVHFSVTRHLPDSPATPDSSPTPAA